MSTVFGRHIVGAIALAAAFAAAPAQADTVNVTVDKAHVMRLPAQVATIVIGNPLIADASLQRGGMLVITGKSFGATNLLALDRNGKIVMDKTVQVLGPASSDMVVVYRGAERETYSCAPECERRVTLGDSPAFFNAAMAQSSARTGGAQVAPPPSGQAR